MLSPVWHLETACSILWSVQTMRYRWRLKAMPSNELEHLTTNTFHPARTETKTQEQHPVEEASQKYPNQLHPDAKLTLSSQKQTKRRDKIRKGGRLVKTWEDYSKIAINQQKSYLKGLEGFTRITKELLTVKEWRKQFYSWFKRNQRCKRRLERLVRLSLTSKSSLTIISLC